MSRPRDLRAGAIALLLAGVTLAGARPALAGRDCPELDPYAPDGYRLGVRCSELVSIFDGVTDRFFMSFPPGYDPSRAVPVFLVFKAAYQSDAPIANPALHGDLAGNYGAIVIGVRQRGPCSFLGDYAAGGADCGATGAAATAAKQDMGELLDQLASRFLVSHVAVAGVSMGGYVAYRLAQLYPAKVSVVLGSAAALCYEGGAPPACPGSSLAAGTAAVYQAAAAGLFDDKLFYTAVGAEDRVPGLLAGNRYLGSLLVGRPRYRYAEVPGIGHENFFGEHYNGLVGLGARFFVSNPAVPQLEQDLRTTFALPRGPQDPAPGWKPPPAGSPRWYFSPELLARGGRPFVSGPPPPTDGGAPDGAPGPDGGIDGALDAGDDAARRDGPPEDAGAPASEGSLDAAAAAGGAGDGCALGGAAAAPEGRAAASGILAVLVLGGVGAAGRRRRQGGTMRPPGRDGAAASSSPGPSSRAEPSAGKSGRSGRT